MSVTQQNELQLDSTLLHNIPNEKCFKSLFQYSQDGIALLSADAIILDVSPAIEKILDLTKEQLVNTSKLDFVSPEDVPTIQTALIQVIKDPARIETVEYRATLPDGSKKWIECIFSNLLNESSVKAIVLNVRDITPRKKNEQQIIESERKYRQIVETAQEGIWIMDEEFKTTFVNQKMCEMLEYTEEEMIGRTNYSFRHNFVLSDILRRRELRKQGVLETHESEFISKSGRVIYTKVSTNPIFDKDGNFKGSLAMVTDVTDIKKAEEEKVFEQRNKEALINSTDDLMWSVSSDFKLIAGNKSFLERMKESVGFQLKVGDNLLIEQKYPASYLDLWKTLYKRALAGESFVEEIQVKNGDPESILWYETSFNPIFHNNTVEGVTCFSANITHKKLATKKLRESEEKYRTIIETAQEGIWQIDENSDTSFVNDFMASLLGYSKEEMLGTSLFEHIDEAGKTVVDEMIKMRQKGVAEQIEFSFLRKDKTFVETILQVAPIFKNQCYAGSLAMVIDNSHRKQAEEKLAKSEKRFRALIEKSADGIVLTSAEGFITYVSPSAERIVELPGNEIIGKHCLQFIEPKFHAHVITTSGHLLTHPSISQTIEYQVKTATGERKWVESTSTNLLDDGAINAVVINLREITERKLFETELKESEARYKTAQKQGRVGHWELNLMDNKLFWSDEIYRITGLEQTTDNLDYNTFTSLIFPEDRQFVDQQVRSAMAGLTKYDIVHRIVSPGRSIRYVHEVGELIKDETGRPLKFAGLVQDVTEQKEAEQKLIQSEEKYRLLFNNSPVPMWIYSIDTFRFLEVNPAAIVQYGYSREEFLNLGLSDIRRDGTTVWAAEQHDENYRKSFVDTSVHYKKNGETIKVHVSVSTIQFENKRARLALLTDRTEQEKIKDDLINTTRQLRELASHLNDIREDERTNMAREIHDELGQQLTGLKMDISWLNRKLIKQDENVRAKIKGSIQLIDGTISTVRKIASDLRPAILDDLGLFEAMDWHSREFSKRTSIEIVFSSDLPNTKLPPQISIALFRIFQEALTNVARHSGATRVESTLGKKGNELTLTISDNGDGFNLDELKERKTLGILGMKERVIMLNGSYEISSLRGKGTVVSVLVPL